MGTRSLTVVKNSDDKDIIVMYRQMDGYPEGMGLDLKEFLTPFTIINGITSEAELKKSANGMQCLSAQIVMHFKEDHGVGGIYLQPSGTRDCGEEYIYTVYENENDDLCMRVQAGAMTFFGLPGTKQGNMPVLFDGLVGDFDAKQANQAEKDAGDIVNDFIEEQTD